MLNIALEPALPGYSLLEYRRSIAGSMAETQEMIRFCAAHNILSEVEMIPIQSINEAYERLLKNDVKCRCVIDMELLKTQIR